jgi:transcription antitermination factor NusG
MTNLGAHIEMTTELHWYAVVTRSRHENIAASALTIRGVTTFSPFVSEMHHWSDRCKVIDVPLFPGYLFVHIPNSREAKSQVIKTSGVVQLVGNREGAVPIQDEEISNVKAILEQKLDCSPYPFLQLGQRVRIRGGSLEGVEGILVGRGSTSTLVISIELIQRSLAISVYNFDVVPIGSRTDRDRPASKTEPWPKNESSIYSA